MHLKHSSLRSFFSPSTKKEPPRFPLEMTWDPFREFEESMRRMMHGMGTMHMNSNGGFGIRSTAQGQWIPNMDLVEEQNTFTVSADLPGMKKEDMEVNVNGNRVCIRGNRPLPKSITMEPSATGSNGTSWVHCSERSGGKFERCFTLPQNINEKSVRAQFSDGVLEVRFEKELGSSSSSNIKIN